jgi:aminoglycoside phosphotransferase (APT) family kinase protein
VPERLSVGVGLVRRLVAAQFPRWAGLPVRPVATPGWDNRSFRLGETMLIRLPSAAPYAMAVEKEQRWLPVFGPRLPLPIPEPLGMGEPGDGYPFPWSVYRWIEGEPATTARIDDLDEFARVLADFLVALQRVDPAGGPTAGLHNFYRGGPLHTYDELMRTAADTLGDRRGPALEIWQEALDAEWDGEPVWFHGDVAAGNLLMRDGRLAAVIDFGTSGVGDPACDLAIAWTLLTGSSRELFRERLAVGDAMWARGRGWALWKAAVDSEPEVVGEILTAGRGGPPPRRPGSGNPRRAW